MERMVGGKVGEEMSSVQRWVSEEIGSMNAQIAEVQREVRHVSPGGVPGIPEKVVVGRVPDETSLAVQEVMQDQTDEQHVQRIPSQKKSLNQGDATQNILE